MSQGQFRVASKLVVFAGQSRLMTPVSPNTAPEQLMARFPGVAWVTIAVTGASWTHLATVPYVTRMEEQGKAGLDVGLVMVGGFSDYGVENDTGATVYANEWAYADAARAAGYSWVACATTLPSVQFTGPQNDERLAGNGLVIADASSKFDASPDPCATSLGANNGTDYSDGTHLTSVGAGKLADSLEADVTAFLAL